MPRGIREDEGVNASATVRLRLDLGYDGYDFSGWAAQPGRRTVEAVLSDALTTMLRAPEPVRLVVAGRTDAGVHARGQVAHADVDAAAFGALPGRSMRSPEAAAVARLQGLLPPMSSSARYAAPRRVSTRGSPPCRGATPIGSPTPTPTATRCAAATLSGSTGGSTRRR